MGARERRRAARRAAPLKWRGLGLCFAACGVLALCYDGFTLASSRSAPALASSTANARFLRSHESESRALRSHDGESRALRSNALYVRPSSIQPKEARCPRGSRGPYAAGGLRALTSAVPCRYPAVFTSRRCGRYVPDAFIRKKSAHNQHGKKPFIFLHAMGVCYMFLALMLVCDNFFGPAIDEMVERCVFIGMVEGTVFIGIRGLLRRSRKDGPRPVSRGPSRRKMTMPLGTVL
ncbi:hypothetical protein M885DRAFT_35558 [Pelagophyceae sp. CCMP2097]|nr:hypothetical protein M885DRAFT_35558 [Pelagophyceae sp. CCMP2097]